MKLQEDEVIVYNKNPDEKKKPIDLTTTVFDRTTLLRDTTDKSLNDDKKVENKAESNPSFEKSQLSS